MVRIGFHLGNDCGVTRSDWAIMERVRPEMIVLLPGYALNPQPIGKNEVRRILTMVPDCHIFLRPYVAPQQIATREGFLAYLDALREVVLSWADVVPDGQRHWQLFNEPNMPRGGEGFGDTDADMRRFNAWFCEAYGMLKRCDGQARIGFTPLTIGNRDAWFAGDPQGAYYMHSIVGCQPKLSEAHLFSSVYSGPCIEALKLADEYYAHVYTHGQAGMTPSEIAVHPAFGQRHERYRLFLPSTKPLWITECGAPSKEYMERPDMGLGILTWLRSLKNVEGVAFWILGNNPKWGGEMWAGRWSLLDQIAQKQGEEMNLDQLAEEAVRQHLISMNPLAALEKAGRARGMAPASKETRFQAGAVHYAAQAFSRPDAPYTLHIARCEIGRWDRIEWAERHI